MNVRILALVIDAFGGAGGISQYNRDVITAWSSLGMTKQVEVLPRFASSSNPPIPDNVIQHAPTASASLYSLRAIMRTLRRRSFDVIFCGHLHMMPLAVIVSKLSGAPVWLQIHGIEAWEQPGGLVRWCIEKAALVTSVSRHTRRQFLRWADVDARRVLVLPNTVGEQFLPELDRETAKEQYGVVGKRVLLTVSRLAKSERYKGHDRIIRILPKIMRAFGNLAYVIAGDGDLRPELEELVCREKLEDVVVFLGPIENDELPALYRAADVFVMPSTGEGFGIVYLEALACGTPVVAGNSDGAHDPLQDGILGTLSDDQHLSAEILRLLGSPTVSGTAPAGEREIGKSVRRYFGRTIFDDLVRTATRRFEPTGESHLRPSL